jgi:hypothetical protein
LNYYTYHTLILVGLIVGAIRTRLEDPQAYPLDAIKVDAIEAADHSTRQTQNADDRIGRATAANQPEVIIG